MRDSLINLFSSQITIEDNGQFYYTVTPFELTNPLGNVIAILQEYNFTKKDDNNGRFSCKLCRTKEGNWYDIEVAKIVTEKNILRRLNPLLMRKKMIQF